MMKLTKHTLLSLAIICLSTSTLTSAFAPTTSRTNSLVHPSPTTTRFAPTTSSWSITTTSTSTQLQEGKYQGTNDGTDRGVFLQLIVFGVCAWLFTIPPEFRRAYLCPADTFCQEEGSCTRECVTPDEWMTGVKNYYKNGGGIQWDFSIDPKTKASNQQKMDAILGNMNNGE
mmetsp:Transcript_38502/g.93161  ORF Transcript_38502/g.93161 Transcript_38502/m.93161 type:complete len:172 (+) Transcript_38502:78-593(+)